MDDTTQTPTESQPNPPATDAGAGSGSGSTGGGVPSGFVPVAELEREQARSRDFQGRADRLQAQIQRLASGGEPGDGGATSGTPKGFDPDAFADQLLNRVYGATALMNASEKLKAEFPHADSSFFEPDVLKEFDSPEALRAVVEADHNRVAAAIKAAVEAAGQPAPTPGQQPSPLGPAGSGGQPTGGDPTVDQLNALTPGELGKFMQDNPGVVERVLSKAGAPVR